VTLSLRRLALPAYVVAAYFIVASLMDALASALPAHPGQETWRYFFAPYLTNYFLSALFGLLLAAIVAAAAEHRVMLWITGAVTGAFAIFMLAEAVVYVLDVLQLAGRINDDELQAFRIGSAKTAIKFVLLVISLTIMAVASVRAARALPGRTA
jgi:hypothetical protein